jgi:hypothetical protein
MRQSNGGSREDEENSPDRLLLEHCERFHGAHRAWFEQADEPGRAPTPETLAKLRLGWATELDTISRLPAKSPAGLQAKLAVGDALREWKFPDDVELLDFVAGVSRDADEVCGGLDPPNGKHLDLPKAGGAQRSLLGFLGSALVSLGIGRSGDRTRGSQS